MKNKNYIYLPNMQYFGIRPPLDPLSNTIATSITDKDDHLAEKKCTTTGRRIK